MSPDSFQEEAAWHSAESDKLTWQAKRLREAHESTKQALASALAEVERLKLELEALKIGDVRPRSEKINNGPVQYP